MAWAVVTGAGSGLGAAIARHAAKAGYRVAVWDLDGDAAEA
nr:SDR family NAD(P)-dependent oxidoreductase [Gordonia sp. (in: high G+C Gram-positive bacteria)]